MDDSLIVYNNALKVYDYYENNPAYLKTRSVELITAGEKKEVYNLLEQGRRMFYVIRREIAKLTKEEQRFKSDVTPSVKYKDITYKEYYSEIDDYRFYERELENQIVNVNAPAPIYDTRIAPILINEYRNIDSNDVYFGDLVNLPLYIPVVVKPYILLSDNEITLRNQILHIEPKIKIVKSMNKKVVESTTTLDGICVYAYNGITSCLIGFIQNRRFIKIRDYKKYAVPEWGRKLLQDDIQFNKMLEIRFGSYLQK